MDFAFARSADAFARAPATEDGYKRKNRFINTTAAENFPQPSYKARSLFLRLSQILQRRRVAGTAGALAHFDGFVKRARGRAAHAVASALGVIAH